MKACFLLLMIVFASGCSMTPSKYFPKFSDQAKEIKDIDIVLDVFIESDIKGESVGIDEAKHEQALVLAEKTVIKEFEKRGYKPNIVYSGYGLMFENDQEKSYVYAKNGKSLNVAFDGPKKCDYGDKWLAGPIKKFFKGIVETASSLGSKDRRKPAVKYAYSFDEIPDLVEDLPSDYLAIVHVDVVEVGSGETHGPGMATGFLSAALSGGLYVYSNSYSTASNVNFAIFDMSEDEGRLIWSTREKGGNSKVIGQTIQNSLRHLPASDGKILSNL